MTPEEIQELRWWSAEDLMGWVRHPYFSGWFEYVNDKEALFAGYKGDWHPDTDFNQCFMVVEKMRELGYKLKLSQIDDAWWAEFWKDGTKVVEDFDLDNPALAILLAARKALETK